MVNLVQLFVSQVFMLFIYAIVDKLLSLVLLQRAVLLFNLYILHVNNSIDQLILSIKSITKIYLYTLIIYNQN